MNEFIQYIVFDPALFAATLVSVVGCVILGIVAYRNDSKNPVNKSFLAVCLGFSLWLISTYWSLITYELIAIRLSMAVAAVHSYTIFLFAKYFSGKKISRPAIVLLAVIGSVAAATAMSPYLFSNLHVDENMVEPVVEPGIIIFAVYAIGCNCWAFLSFIRNMRSASRIQQIQSRFVSVGFVLTMTLMIFFNFVVVNLFKTSEYIPVGMISTLIFVGCTTYAITRYRLFGLRVALTKNRSYIAILVGFDIIMLLFLTFVLLHDGVGWVAAVIVVVGAGFHYFLSKSLSRLFDRLFFVDELVLSKRFSEDMKRFDPMRHWRMFIEDCRNDLGKAVRNGAICMYTLQRQHNRLTLSGPGPRKYIPLTNAGIQAIWADGHENVYWREDQPNPAIRRLMKRFRAELIIVGRGKNEKQSIASIAIVQNGVYFQDDLDHEEFAEFIEKFETNSKKHLNLYEQMEGVKYEFIDQGYE